MKSTLPTLSWFANELKDFGTSEHLRVFLENLRHSLMIGNLRITFGQSSGEGRKTSSENLLVDLEHLVGSVNIKRKFL